MYINYRYYGIIKKSQLQTATWTFENIITLEEIRKYNNLATIQTNWDDRFKLFRASAIKHIEDQTNSYILPTNVDISLCNFSNIEYNNYPTSYFQSNSLILKKNKIQNINSITYKDTNNQQQTLDIIKTRLVEDSSKSILYYNTENEYFPSVFSYQYNSIENTVNINCNVAMFTSISDFNSDTSKNTTALLIKNFIQIYIKQCFDECVDGCSDSDLAINNIKYNISQIFPIYDIL